MIISRHATKSLLPLAASALTAKAAEFLRLEDARSRRWFITSEGHGMVASRLIWPTAGGQSNGNIRLSAGAMNRTAPSDPLLSIEPQDTEIETGEIQQKTFHANYTLLPNCRVGALVGRSLGEG